MANLHRSYLSDKAITWAGVTATLIGVSFLVYRSVWDPRPEIDFRFFWLAGKLWSMGIDPYSNAFERLGATLLPEGNKVIYWFYPPQWWIICRPLAQASLENAVMIWRLASSGLILAGTAILVFDLSEGNKTRRVAYIGFACGFAAIIEPTANLLAFGQSSALVYLSLCLLVVGIRRGNHWLFGAAIVVATFKPQIGAVLILTALLLPQFRITVIYSIAIAGLMCLPQIIHFGPLVTIQEFLSNLSGWSDLGSNTPVTSSGPMHLLARAGLENLNLQVQLAASFLAVAISFAMIRNPSTNGLVRPLFLAVAAIAALVPLHIYDLTILIIPLILYVYVEKRVTILTVILAVLLIRPGKIEAALGVRQYVSDVSMGLIILTMISLCLLVLGARMVRRPAPQLHQPAR